MKPKWNFITKHIQNFFNLNQKENFSREYFERIEKHPRQKLGDEFRDLRDDEYRRYLLSYPSFR